MERGGSVEEIVRDGHVIEVRTHPDRGGATTLEVAVDVGCPGLELAATPGNYFIAAGRQDVKVGHADFDDRYIVKTPDLALVRFWLGLPELEAILATYDPVTATPFGLVIRDGRATFATGSRPARSGDLPDSVPRRDEAIAAAVKLAGCEARELDAWRIRAAELGGRVVGDRWSWTGQLAIVFGDDDDDQVQLDFSLGTPWSRRSGPRTRVWLPRTERNRRMMALSRQSLPTSERPRLADDVGETHALGPLSGQVADSGWGSDALLRFGNLDELAIAAGIDWAVVDEATVMVGWDALETRTPRLRTAVGVVRDLERWVSRPGATTPPPVSSEASSRTPRATMLTDQVLERDGHEIRVERRPPPVGTGDLRPILELSAEIGCARLEVRAFAGSYFIAAGRQDAIVGHAAFDDRYVVKTRDLDVLRFWLDDDVLDAILSTYEPTAASPFALRIANGRAVLHARPELVMWGEPEPAVARTDEAVDALAALAGRERRLLDAWTARAGQIGGELVGDRWTWTDDLAIVAAAGEAEETRVDFPFVLGWSARRGPRTRVWTRRYQPGEPALAVSRPDQPRRHRPRLPGARDDADRIGALHGAIAAGLPARPPHLDAIADAAAVDWIVVDASIVSAGWEAIESRPDRLRSGIELVRALALWLSPTATDGPYR